MNLSVKCPSDRCGIVFEPPERWLGRNMYCPACGVRMTAKPLAVERELSGRTDRSAQSEAEVERLPFMVLVDNVRSLWNIGSIFRTADGCGVHKVVLTGISGCPPRAEISKTALGAERAMAWEYTAEPARALDSVTRAGYRPVALEHTSRAISLDEYVWPERVCLVVGNEVAGVSARVLEACPDHVTLPMRGVKDSFNVAVAFGIAAFRAASSLAGRVALALLLLPALLSVPGFGATQAADEEITIPFTLRKLWYRGEKQGGKGLTRKRSGDLVVTSDALELYAAKTTRSVPVSAVRMISRGKFGKNPDLDWVVLSMELDGTTQRVGFRDGRKFGFGQRTDEIFRRLLGAAEQLGWAQFRAPPGFEAYAELDHVFAMAVPEGWASYHHELVSGERYVVWGIVVFSPQPLTSVSVVPTAEEGGERDRALRRIQSGEQTAWIVRRVEASRGMSCAGFTEKAKGTVADWIAADPFFGEPAGIAASPRFDSASLDGCSALALRTSIDAGGDETPVLDLRVVSRDGLTIVVGLRTMSDRYAADRDVFEQALETFHFAVAHE